MVAQISDKIKPKKKKPKRLISKINNVIDQTFSTKKEPELTDNFDQDTRRSRAQSNVDLIDSTFKLLPINSAKT